MAEQFQFQAEIQQLLNILVHSLYTDREIFLRELISNASDALNRAQFEALTNREMHDAGAPLEIRITADEQAATLTVSDSGIGMTHDELINNLGVIARSGAKAFLEALKDKNGTTAQDVIGQFGVGFYSAFMVADKIRVVSRSYQPDAPAYAWESDGGNTYSIEPAQRDARGTDIILHLKDDAKDFLREWTLKDIIRRHSDYIAFPIFVGAEAEASNKRSALWRQDPKDISDAQYDDFYKMYTLDFKAPLHRIHMRADVPLQFFALLYVPGSGEQNMFSPRKEAGLKLYTRKVLIQEYNRELLPEYLAFMQGVVDSEDIPLNVSRESVQATRIMATLKKTLTNKVLSEFKRLLKNKRETYEQIFATFGRYLKQGVAITPQDRDDLQDLLLFPSTRSAAAGEVFTLDEYVERMVRMQTDIYYIIGDDYASASRSPHLDAFRQRGIEVLYLVDAVDTLVPLGLNEYKGHKLRNVDEADIDVRDIGEPQQDAAPQPDALADADFGALRERFKTLLGERVRDVRESKTLTASAARLVSDEGGAQRNMFRINRLLDREYELPVKILELNPRHRLLHNLSRMLAADARNPLIDVVAEQLFETALLQDGLHPDPAAMAARLQVLMQAATGTPPGELGLAAEDAPES
ncbi:MAG: molecular chaperone HtpG [Chloroflexi bacterium]|nr:molecular chaperone HtpG [Chloroflexota bacterium]